MKHQLFVWLFVSLFLLAVPSVQTFASDDEVEITLLEVSGVLSGDEPLDDPLQEGDTPPQPNDFRATITGSTLAVSSGTHATRVLVRNSVGNTVLDRQFVGGTVEQMPTVGNYSLEIQSGALILMGMFEVE